MSDGKVIYEVRADDSKLTSDLNKVQSTIKRDAKNAANSMAQEAQSAGDEIERHARNTGDSVNGVTDNVASSFSQKISSLPKVAGAAFAAIGTAAVAVGTTAVTAAVDLDKAINQFAASTGTAQSDLGAYEETLKSIYANNYGESFEDIANAMATVTQQVGELDQSSLQSLTENAFLLRDTFEYDVGESVRAASTMMKQFGIDGDTAMGLIAAGAQNGLDFSGELIDSINEYSVHFAKVGLDAADMFAIFEAGAEGGAFNIDKIGDAVKEMSLLVLEGSDDTVHAMSLIGLNWDEMAYKMAAGGEPAKEAFMAIVEGLAEMEDPLMQNIAGVGIFGTMWEDLGADAVTALADISSGAYETGGNLQQLSEIKYDDLGSMLEGLKRSVELLLVPLGEALIPAISEIATALMPIIEELMPPLTELLGSIINELLPPIVELLDQILPPIMELVQTFLPPLIELAGALIEPLTQLFSAILPPLVEMLQMLLEPILQLIESLLPPLIELFSSLGPLLEALSPIITALATLLSGVLSAAFQIISPIIEGVIGILDGLIQFITGVFTGNWQKAWDGVKKIFSSMWEALKSLFKTPINWIIDKLNSFLQGLNKIKIPDWVPGIGGKGFNIPKIPKLKLGLDYVPSDDFPALLHKGEAVLTAEDAAVWRAIGGSSRFSLDGALSNSSNIVYKIDKFADYFVIREEADIDKISSALYRQIRQRERARGIY